MTPDLDPEERAAIVAEWRRLTAEAPPFNPRPVGCAVFLVAGAVILFLPKLTDMLGLKLPQPFGMILLVVLGLAVAGGFFVGVFMGSGVYGRAHVRAHAALDRLVADAGTLDAETRRRNAVELIHYTVVWDGPTVSQTLEPGYARKRLGVNRPYVLAVERVLAEELKIPPVFASEEVIR